ncbi:MAG: ABC transporter ATP-binding protein [Thermoleophilia bacterium]|nr:ABC transporter ATP-binding protein [Thermoleophilia bacterium]
MRVHQPGGHLMRGGRAEVDDWSWQQTKRRLKALYWLARPYKARTALAIVSLLGATAVALAPPYLVGRTVDEVKRHDTSLLGWFVVAFVGAGALSIVFSYAQTYYTGWTGERMLADLRNLLFRHLQRLSLGFYERNRAGVIISRLTNDVEALDQLVTDGVTSLVQNSLTLVGTAVILFFLDWRLALATLVVMPAMAVATALFRKRSGRAYRRVRESLGAVTATLAEDIAGMRVLQSFTREPAARENFRSVSSRYRASNMDTVVLNGVYFPVVDFLSSAATAVVLGYGGWLAFHGHVSIGILVAFLGYLSNFFDPVQQLSQLYNTFLSAVAALDKITDLLDEEPEVLDAGSAVELADAAGHVAFEDVRFAYGRGPEVLHGLDLDVPAGTTVALVGHTGAGKSTIAKLLARFYDPTEGRITIDGVDLRSVSQSSLRRQLGIVPQEGFLFAGTAAENIAFGRPGAGHDEVVAAARAVGADEFIERLENGYRTQLGERGSRLSLGQRQLLAFARALLADPRILILDEATSSVDIGTERKIERALRRLLHGRTAFIIAHRLSTIRDADLIVVLEHGQVVEQGTHDELIARPGLYTSLYGDWASTAA